MHRDFGMLRPRAIALPILVALVLPGCAFHPVLDNAQNFNPGTTEGIPCSTRIYSTALKCAATLNAELSEITKDAHDYNLGSSYTAWGLGTITGGVLAFGGDEDVLKGLAVGVGSLVGLNAVVKPDEQLKIARDAQKELQCVVSVAEAVHASQSNANITGISDKSQRAIARITDDRANAMTPFLVAGENGAPPKVDGRQIYSLFMFQAQDQQFKVMSKTAEGVAASVGSESDLAANLSSSLLTIRGRVADQLAAISSTKDDASKDQRDLVVGMAGEIIRKRADLKKQQEAAAASGDAGHQEVALLARGALAATAGIDEAFAKCADPATLEALRN